jgi:hypothetical protein
MPNPGPPSRALTIASGLVTYSGASAMMSHFIAMSVVLMPSAGSWVGVSGGPKGNSTIGIVIGSRLLRPPLGRDTLPIATISIFARSSGVRFWLSSFCFSSARIAPLWE